MASIAEPVTIPGPVIKKKPKSDDDLAPTYNVICWDDPVNLMVFVTHVFMKIFGWNKQKPRNT
jgi:ATP-dependent Clp protease adaptor protein ClpS